MGAVDAERAAYDVGFVARTGAGGGPGDESGAGAGAPVPGLAARVAAVGGSPVRDILAVTSRPEVVNFAGGLPAPELFDTEGIAAAYRDVLAESAGRALQYATTEGEPVLRTALAARYGARGLATGADDILVTTGSQQALSLLATALLEPGDVVLVEDPCYLAALQAFRFAGARVVAVPGDAHGVDPAALEESVLRHRPKLFYTVPTFQNPTGRTLPAERRAAVASVAARRGLWIVEDDPYGELRFEGDRVPWIASYPGAEDRTALLGSFSKVMAPGMRLGWLRAPAALRRACAVAKQAADLHTPTVNQLAAARYLADRDLDAHVGRVADAYRERRDTMLAGLAGALPEGSTWDRPEGGMFLWARLPSTHDTGALLPRVVARDVAYVPGAPFYAGEPDRSTLRLCFVTQTPEEIREGLRRLGAGLRG
ncbi:MULTISPECIES: PLP-dependent aminotransferase family protein [Streptomyces]|uniref:PLP-dependent aminotransferase family protein n=1 Tax=Streptomyces caniscabiei TaxID=2746961 RepID=A0ABU4MZH9_9ACTN|nr:MULTISPECIES: PLP-dependent aminotransferase family protein [Streptomyces]MDX2942470.1 PLP-dependent aminotransferase family protein [Streptomyces caniscabiei]MDX2957290.1 PLP-dependent aminotransferase family protein [Streptomyces caniscabiei]MDX2984614.1 PLP-dependent aminotransferase family protein [Streptomyces caniscabiei]MDX3008194.1 PLP-dependent aminotransferase family protein [Streptomyces caniscabiei]MDX3042940.1 PLP-dependent aminotransferase family protein [Streptomyces caniscab